MEFRQISSILFAVLMLNLPLFTPTSGQASFEWGAWGECSERCNGVQNRTRECPLAGQCSGPLTEERECNTNSCLRFGILITLVVICVIGLIAIIIVIVLCCKVMRERSARKKETGNWNVKEMRDYSVSTSLDRSRHRFPSSQVSFPEPRKVSVRGEDRFEHDDESIWEGNINFGNDELYKPQV